ncbi:hypothetical protein Q4Q35_02905 [Flavivirga aquimarina]|uniref:Lipocalin-like domain-containing protein n=1 Tax=Flavivirga aquimarina TaxID=2027862 RepID=A0ABT8W6K2_9FLAO|nr:hypothetical protein [Flavivirga aquimarina]MDO5968744.1 hypothetical protein [Flavivirga aquimarina]
MKRNLLIILTCFFVLTNCSLNDDNNSDDTVVFTTWHLTNVTGGLAGVDDTFDLKTIIWIFDGNNSVITVVNNNTDDTKVDGLDSGTYDFSIITEGDDEFLVVENNEMGLLTTTTTQSYLEIDENSTSEGDVADGFIYTFKKVLEVQE